MAFLTGVACATGAVSPVSVTTSCFTTGAGALAAIGAGSSVAARAFRVAVPATGSASIVPRGSGAPGHDGCDLTDPRGVLLGLSGNVHGW